MFSKWQKVRFNLSLLVLAFVLGIAPILMTSAFASTPDGGSLAPMHPEFEAYMKQKVQGILPSTVTSDGHAMGYIPSPVDWSHLKAQHAMLSVSVVQSAPSRYDLRTLNKLTPVRDQGTCGACWVFGTFGSLESALMPGESNDFSENNLKNLHGFDRSPCEGGNYDISTGYLVRWGGPVSEADDPYNVNDYNTSPSGFVPVKHVQNVVILPGRTGPTDNDIIKNAVMTWGAVGVYMYYNNSYYSSATH